MIMQIRLSAVHVFRSVSVYYLPDQNEKQDFIQGIMHNPKRLRYAH